MDYSPAWLITNPTFCFSFCFRLIITIVDVTINIAVAIERAIIKAIIAMKSEESLSWRRNALIEMAM